MSKHNLNINGTEFTIFKDERVWGDGSHESTKVMMDLISKYGVEGKPVIDIGTGTGILSVLSAKLGAGETLAIDIDEYAVEWAGNNLIVNNAAAETMVNNLLEGIEKKADVILANLPYAAQVENVKTVGENLNENGIFIMTWWNTLKFEEYVTGFEVIEHIPGVEYDGYVLRNV